MSKETKEGLRMGLLCGGVLGAVAMAMTSFLGFEKLSAELFVIFIVTGVMLGMAKEGIRLLYKFVSYIMWIVILVYLADTGYTYYKYVNYPKEFAIQSAPWYTGAVFFGVFTIIVGVVCLLLRVALKHKMQLLGD